jgi:hypothetical protein
MAKKITGSHNSKSTAKTVLIKSSILLILIVQSTLGSAQFRVDVQLRNRFEVRDGYQKLTTEDATPAVFVSQRTRLSFSYETVGLKLKITPQDVRVWGDETSSSATGVFGDNASLELFEGYAEIKIGKSWLSVGRQQLVYDGQRILAARNWNQSGLAYDAAVLKLAPKNWNIHIGGSWNSTGENASENFYDPARIKSLNFIWAKRAIAKGWDVSLSHVASGVSKSVTENTLYFRQTSGIYTVYKSSALNFWGNVYYQFGKNQPGKEVSAFLADAEVNYNIGNFTPGAGISYLSGNSKTGESQTTDHLFDVLYGGRHQFFGFMDYFRSFGSNTKQGGLTDIFFNLQYKFNDKIVIKNTGHYFWLAQTNPTTPANKNLGYENDLILKYQFSTWGNLECGYFFVSPTASLKTIQGVANGKFSQFLYAQLTLTPTLFK